MAAPENEPLTDDRRASLLLTLLPGVGPLARQRLLQRFGDAPAVLAADRGDLLTVQGVGPKLAEKLVAAEEHVGLDAQLEAANAAGVRMLLEADTGYPALLREIPDPPGVLFVRGNLESIDQLAVGIVGTRHGSRYGLDQAERFAAGLARAGITVVSGMARGIDTAAHRGALEAGGRTVAVLASGVLRPYPPENADLAERIARQGAVLSEAGPTMPPISGMFPQRNRIISGLSLGVVVIEAAERSGALITARHAGEQNRQLFALPGPVDSRLSRGPHRLLRDGAILVRSIEDVIEDLGPLMTQAERNDGATIRTPRELSLNEIEQQVLRAIEPTGSLVDEITAATGLPVQRVLSTIHVLEMRSLVRRLGGNRVARI
ncbi:MAG: DNA-processing protein DprA [Planctomycetota bacterium]